MQFPFFITLAQDNYKLSLEEAPLVVDLDIIVSNLYKFYVISKAFSMIGESDPISTTLYPSVKFATEDRQKTNFEKYFDHVHSIILENTAQDTRLMLEQFIKLIKYNFRKKWIKKNQDLEDNEQAILEKVEKYLFLPPSKVLMVSELEEEALVKIKSYIFNTSLTNTDGVIYLKKILDMNRHEMKPINTTPELKTILIKVAEFLKHASLNDKVLMNYLQERWGRSLWHDGKTINELKQLPTRKQLLSFLHDWELIIGNPALLSQENMQALIRLKNIYYGQQHHFKLDVASLEEASCR